MPLPIRSRRSPRAGFTILEVTLAMFIFLIMMMLFAAVFPAVVRGAQFSNNYTIGSVAVAPTCSISTDFSATVDYQVGGRW